MSKIENPIQSQSSTDINTYSPQETISNISEIEINKKLLSSIANTLSLVLEATKKLHGYKKIVKHQSKMSFSSSSEPSISLYDYLIRIQTYGEISDSTLILGLIYIDRVCDISQICLTAYNIHRLLFSAILVAIKYNEDKYYENDYYAQIAGIKNKELKVIEYDFLNLINFELFVKDSVYSKYEKYLSTN